MSPESGRDETEAIKRGRRALHISHAYAIALLAGPKLGPRLFRVLNEENEHDGPWRRVIDEKFSSMCQVAPGLLQFFLQPDSLKPGAYLFCAFVEQSILSQLPEGELAHIWSTSERMMAKLQEVLKEVQGDDKPPLGEELDVDLKTLAKETGRLRAAIPPGLLGLGERERSNLEDALGMQLSDRGGENDPDQFEQTILPSLLQLAFRPEEMRRGTPRADSPIWEWAEMDKPPLGRSLTPEEMGSAIGNILNHVATLEGRREMTGYLLGRELRHEYGLGKGRNVDTFSEVDERRSQSASQQRTDDSLEAWDPEAADSMRSFDDAEIRMIWEAIQTSAPPAQREAMELYREASESGRTLAEVCREHVKDPNLVRNNFQALSKAVRKRDELP